MSAPGPKSASLAERLRAVEQRNVTYLAEDFPVFWRSARGAIVTDVDGNEYVDCTAAFGVANVGHANARVAEAVANQANRLAHGMGDVHPTEVRVQLLERLTAILPNVLTKAFLATTGSEAIEAALKTAMLATGKSRFLSYRGAYHGLSFGALAVGGIERFRSPFAAALAREPALLEYPRGSDPVMAAVAIEAARKILAEAGDIAALVIEPIQGRAGCIVPPPGYLSGLRDVCDEFGVLMIVDEIFTGFGRTGNWFAVEHEGVVPDILCIGKAMGGGVPISAAVGRPAIMDAWPASRGEALHTSTYLGNPLGCAAALATIDELQNRALPARANRLDAHLGGRLGLLRGHPEVLDVRGRGMFWGVQLRGATAATEVVRRTLRDGIIFLQTGIDGDTIAISPPLVIEEPELDRAIDALERAFTAAR